MRVLIIGGNGNMGRRYSAILKFLGHEVTVVDTDNIEMLQVAAKECNRIIVTTPTENHIPVILQIAQYYKPILCEKPITKSMDELLAFKAEMSSRKAPFRMVDNYRFVDFKDRLYGVTKTEYSYYNTGKDGKHWDCIQLYGLATAGVEIETENPVWSCIINGRPVKRESIDNSYVKMIRDWLQYTDSNWEFIERAHEKVIENIGR